MSLVTRGGAARENERRTEDRQRKNDGVEERESTSGDDNTNMQKQADSSNLNHFLVGVTTVDYLPIV